MPGADQLVYTRVEAAYSPRKHSGYQTVYRSRELTDADADAIEARVSAFRGDADQVRLQYFRLPDGRAVVAHTKKIPTDRTYVDRNGRPGPFIAHCLVIGEADFQRAGCDPFAVLDGCREQFLTDAQVMVERLEREFTSAPRVEWQTAPAPTPADRLDPARVGALAGWAAAAGRPDRGGGSVHLRGEPGAVAGALRLVFERLPPALRAAATFDTLAGPAGAAPGVWFVGSPAALDRTAVTIDLAAAAYPEPPVEAPPATPTRDEQPPPLREPAMLTAEHAPVCDRAGAPMIWVEALGAHLHFLPVTKFHFESFLCDPDPAAPDRDQAWYEKVTGLGRNGREAITMLRPENYWKAFMTGVRPDEAQAYADWNNNLMEGFFQLPSREQWYKAYQELQQRPEVPPAALDRMPLSPRYRMLLDRLRLILRTAATPDAERRLADQMLLRRGVMEWVQLEDQRLARWGGFGETPQGLHNAFHNALRTGNPEAMPRADDERYEHYGFRLIRREF